MSESKQSIFEQHRTHPEPTSRVGFSRQGELASSVIRTRNVGIFQKRRIDMSLRINDIAPDFTAETTHGTIHFHDWIGDNWAVLFSHPKDFTPVCTTELGAVASLEADFAKRGAKVIGLSVDPVENHGRWAKDILDVTGSAVNYPIICDTEFKVVKLYDMLANDAGDRC